MKTMDQGSSGPSGSWTHSFEEDEADVLVYRPTQSFGFPPSRRARETLDFSGPGQVSVGLPGPDDRPQFGSVGLTPLGMNRFRLGDAGGGAARIIEVIEVSADKLKLRAV